MLFYNPKPIIIPIPASKIIKPTIAFFVNFSFRIIKENNIVIAIDSLPILFTTTGFAPAQFNASYSKSQAAPVAIPEMVRNIHDFDVIFCSC